MRPFDEMSRALSPRSRADSRPGASARLEMTTAILACNHPAFMDSAIASKLVPRPESRMPSFLGAAMRSGVEDLAVAFHDAANQVSFFPGLLNHRLYAFELLRRNRQHHTDAHVERAHHVVLRHVADLLHVAEDGKNGPGAHLDDGGRSFRQYARQIVRDAAARDVRHGVNQFGSDQLAKH